MKRCVLFAVAAALIAAVWCGEAGAFGSIKNRVSYRQSQTYPWHGGYYDTAWGAPVAVVVPPRAESQTHWGWGVGATRVTPNQHQFQRAYPGYSDYQRSRFRPTPAWPTSTDQFGNYYVRGPW